MIKLIIKPYDVLLFRESKPFMAGDSHLARTTLPLPQTIAGAIRSYILLLSGFSKDNLEDEKVKRAMECIGYGNDEPNFEILGTFLASKGEEIFPIPKNYFKNGEKFARINPGRFGSKLILIPKGKSEGNVFITKKRLLEYLRGGGNEISDIIRVDSRERRIGIKLNERKVTEEGMLYSVEFLRWEQLIVWIKDLCWKLEEGVIRLGGEGRFAKFEKVFSDEELLKGNITSEKPLFYFATPIMLKGGVQKLLDKIKNSAGGVNINDCLLVTDRPLAISGWNYVKNKPRGTRYAIPAGGVLFLEFEKEVTLPSYLKLGTLTKLGYGLTFVGVWE